MRRFIGERLFLHKCKMDDNIRTQEIEKLNILWDLFHERGIHQYDKLLNVCIYVLLVNRDIYYLAEYYYFQKNEKRKNLFGRLFSMTIVEFLDDITYLLGVNLTNELNNNNLDEFISDVKSLHKQYSDIKKRYYAELREIRNNAAAHKNKDSKKLLVRCNI